MSDHLLYADDLKIFSISEAMIQKDLMTLSNWCSKWQMSVAPKKCESITFSPIKNHSMRSLPELSLNNIALPSTNIIRDLGVMFASDLSFANHITTIICRAQARVNIIFNILRHSTFDVVVKCYTIYIRPILEYATVVFSPTSKSLIRKMESVQKSLVHRCLLKGGILYKSYFDGLEICGLETLEYRRLIYDLVHLYKCIVSKETTSSNNLFILLPELKSLRRHKYYIRCSLLNDSKCSTQFLTNRVIGCWNSLPDEIFPVKISTRSFKNNVSSVDLTNYLILNPNNY
uniref:Reverse transcriptase domain-containing protein n=1 Tax=Caenorhabditis japonica TaxID=281687 RepID=A0A8R1EDU0_CAEJA